ncbi:MAG: OmpH family outer membrane protein [Synergistaceae bacterium]|nr:OmpH family outer membrane protein [Synergistaceae bacterium]MBQ6435225.1 OmpH family outer membrane protein [Synergistaceae bacterium]MBQ7068274.1 OmpH family outer membrane protein [Synergistaceae bacterium]MBR0074178.1 OmpH family outer membrane protein [Synergistaceae bacterium]MBR0234544.1 OmpH family outer membrane protein [Synergistaceae bacterium]
MVMKKIILLFVAVSLIVMGFAMSASAAAKKSSSSTATVSAESVGIVDRGEILNNHPDLPTVRQKLADTARQKENEAKAAADKETDTAKKAQAVQAKRMELAQEEQKLMAPIYADCERAVREVATKKKLTLVLDKFVVLIGGVDITQDVIQQLSRKK